MNDGDRQQDSTLVSTQVELTNIAVGHRSTSPQRSTPLSSLSNYLWRRDDLRLLPDDAKVSLENVPHLPKIDWEACGGVVRRVIVHHVICALTPLVKLRYIPKSASYP